jgi:hypothetical protein
MPWPGPALQDTFGRVWGPANATRAGIGERGLASVAGCAGSNISVVPLNHQLMLHSGVAG